jgi:cation diffusion facilitator CzcD-associated flavoprotein CzcO
MQAVIGAGAAGLVAARELVLEGHHVTVFEKGSSTGGVWVYTDEVEAPDLLGMHQLHLSVCIQVGMAILIVVTHPSACANLYAHSICLPAYWLGACIIPSAQPFVRKEHVPACQLVALQPLLFGRITARIMHYHFHCCLCLHRL